MIINHVKTIMGALKLYMIQDFGVAGIEIEDKDK